MPRPTNEDLLSKPVRLDAGTEAAVAAAQAEYPQGRALEAKKTDDGFQVVMGWKDDSGFHVVDVTLDANNAITETEDRPEVPPGQAKKAEGEAHGKSGEAPGRNK